MRYFVSWEQPTEDYRPLTFPPNENILGWWCSGETMDGIYILCSIVIANNKEEAEKYILKDWPEAKNWRFCEQKEKYLEELYQKSTLPHRPDEDKIKEILLQVLEQHYGSLEKAITLPEKESIYLKQIGDAIRNLGY